MATESFYEMMRIDTPEKAKRLMKAFEDAENRGPVTYDCDVFKEIEEGKRIIRRQSH